MVATAWERAQAQLAKGLVTAQQVGAAILAPFDKKEVDAIYVVYNEFKSAMTQRVTVEPLLPVPPAQDSDGLDSGDFLFEPSRTALLEHLAPLYVDISILRALYESMASELGARMTAMDAATKNATEMIDKLTLEYNKLRQANITRELLHRRIASLGVERATACSYPSTRSIRSRARSSARSRSSRRAGSSPTRRTRSTASAAI